jgi:small neutral amino acid transporter SnatA (MarC family)
MSLIGLPIGFYGYLFPGNINIMVLDLYGTKKYKLLSIILALVVIFESAYCLVSLFYLNKIKTNILLFSFIEVVAYLLVLAMGLWMLFENKSNENAVHKNTLIRGVLSIIVHPQQIPFWIVIGVLINPILSFTNNWNTAAGFILCNALGTLLVMSNYMVYGNKLMQYFKVKLNKLNTGLGILYILLAVYSLSKLFINFK